MACVDRWLGSASLLLALLGVGVGWSARYPSLAFTNVHDPASNLDTQTVANRPFENGLHDFSYDRLHRLDLLTYPDTTSEDWQLDDLSNWETYTGRDAGVTTYADNTLNQYTSISGGATSPLHDAKGNLVRNERGYGFTYDFENRLTRVFTDSDLDGQYDGGEPVHAEYVVDALGRRAVAMVAGVTTYRYYDGAVVVAEFDAGAPATPIACYLNGPNYLDEKLLIKAGAGSSDEYYVLLKDLYTVAGVTDADGDLFEWYTYTGYGLPTIHGTGLLAAAPLLFGDADGDCDVDLADFAGFQAFFSGAGNPHAPGGAVFDSDGDGDVDFADFEAFAANLNGPGSGSCATRVNPFAFTGQRVDVLDGGALVLYDYKARVYDPLHGRFQQRDPAEFADTYNLYEYAASRPTVLTDPTGRQLVQTLGVTGIQARLGAVVLVGAFAAHQLASALQDALASYSFSLSLNVRAAELFTAGQTATAEALFALGGLVLYSSTKGQKEAVRQAEDLLPRIEEHIDKLLALGAATGGPPEDPNSIVRELNAWLDRIEKNLDRMGKRTADRWKDVLRGLRERIDEALGGPGGPGGPVGT